MSLLQFQDKSQTIYQHLADLRKFLLIGVIFYIIIFGVCLYFTMDIYTFLASPLLESLMKYELDGQFIATGITEVFSSYIYLAFISSLILFIPTFLFLIFLFVFASISVKERRIFISILVLIPILFIIGVLFAYFTLFSIIWDFFIKISFLSTNISFLPKIETYITTAMNIIIVFGIIFEIPVVVILLSFFNLLTSKIMLKFTKYIVLFAFMIGAILTPPDPFSQIIVAGAIIFLYAFSYLALKLINK